MALNERLEKIKSMIQKMKRLSVNDLSERFNVSSVTIRKDLEELQALGVLVRTHGGAVLAEDVERSRAIVGNRGVGVYEDRKHAIASKTLELIANTDTVLLDSGGTNWAIAQLLKDTEIRVVTNSMTVINTLSQRPSGSLVCIGGNWYYDIAAFFGPTSIDALQSINVDVAIIGTNGFSIHSGFSSVNMLIGQLKAAMLKRARSKYIVADSTKWDVSAFHTFAEFSDVDVLITDSYLPEGAQRRLEEAGLEVVIAPVIPEADPE